MLPVLPGHKQRGQLLHHGRRLLLCTLLPLLLSCQVARLGGTVAQEQHGAENVLRRAERKAWDASASAACRA